MELSIKYVERILVYLDPREHVGGCKCRPIYVKLNPKTEANVIVSECTICSRLLNYTLLFSAFYILHFEIKNAALVYGVK